MNADILQKYELSMSLDPDDLEKNLQKLVVNAHRIAQQYSTLADDIGSASVDDKFINKYRQDAIVSLDPERRQAHLDEVANFRNHVVRTVQQDRDAIFFIAHMMEEINELVTSITDLVIREQIPQKSSEERDAKVEKAYGLYDEFDAITTLIENFTNFYTTMFDLNTIDTSDWTSEEDNFEVKVKTLKDGSKKFALPKPHSPIARFGEKKEKKDVTTLAILFTEVDGEKTGGLTVSEFALLHVIPATQLFTSTGKILKAIDTRKSSGVYTYEDKDGNEHSATWEKSAL